MNRYKVRGVMPNRLAASAVLSQWMGSWAVGSVEVTADRLHALDLFTGISVHDRDEGGLRWFSTTCCAETSDQRGSRG
jgi:hypothetical protein